MQLQQTALSRLKWRKKEEGTREELTAVEIVQAGVTQGRIELDSVHHRGLDEAEELLIQRSVCHCMFRVHVTPLSRQTTAIPYIVR